MFSCKSNEITSKENKMIPVPSENVDFAIAFGSCNKQYEANHLWDDVRNQNPNIWVWGGDIIYSDTDNMTKMKKDYETQLQQKGYDELIKSVEVHGTWDDHDYGLNDGGYEYVKKDESQQQLLDFFGVSKENKRRQRKGVYYSKIFNTKKGSVRLIVLDTRYFRTELTISKSSNRRYDPNPHAEGTILGATQWKWLERTLYSSTADFNIVLSSIQFLSQQHGYETWGTMPNEVDRMYDLIIDSKAKGVILLSGDRHISEFSKKEIEGLSYPLIDFTSSGMTHSYSNFKNERNDNRVGKVISKKSFGVLKFNFETQNVTMQMIGDGNEVQQELKQKY
jgi:alkaline phosphatase D